MRRTAMLIAAALAAAIVLPAGGRAYSADLPSFPTPGSCPTGLAFDGTSLWAADRKSDLLYRVAPDTGKVLATLEAPGYLPQGLAWDGSRLWCADAGEQIIAKINIETGVAEHVIPSPDPDPGGLAWDGTYLWVAGRKAGRLFQVSLEDGTEIRSLAAPGGSTEGLSWDGRYLWVADRGADEIYLVEPADGDVITAFKAPGPYVTGLAWTLGGLYAADFQDDKVYRVHVADPEPYVRSDPRREVLTVTHEVRNYGPGDVLDLAVYIAVPETRPDQDILGEPVYSPQPDAIVMDRWGQKTAVFSVKELKATQSARFSVEVKGVLYNVRWHLLPGKAQSFDTAPDDIKKLYLEDNEKFRLQDPAIREAVEAALKGVDDPLDKVRALGRYVADHVDYELAGGWNIAPAVLRSGKGSCSEYTFVFIALCRAAGIPARYVGSVSVRGDDASIDDVFHRWAEVYVPGYGWVPVDATVFDQASPGGRGSAFGRRGNANLVTTVNGGGSETMGWNYNSNDSYTFKGPCKVVSERIGEWTPLGAEEEAAPVLPAPQEGGACKPRTGP